MAAIGKVEYRINNDFIGFLRGRVLFAMVQQGELYCLNGNGSLVKFEQPIDSSSIQTNLIAAYNIAV